MRIPKEYKKAYQEAMKKPLANRVLCDALCWAVAELMIANDRAEGKEQYKSYAGEAHAALMKERRHTDFRLSHLNPQAQSVLVYRTERKRSEP